jgi:LmbE family N-acetylglucosaminyl deacetylase
MDNVKPVHAVVATPHPDDAEFGVAGTVARWTREGKDVVYVVCTNGDKGTSDPDMDPAELARIREEEQLAAAELLGVREVVFLRHPDQTLEDTPEFRKELVRLIRTYRPHTVVTADPYRRYLWHRDHRIVGRVVMDAVFPYARDVHSYPDLYWEEGLEPHKVREVLLWGSPEVNYRLDITDTWELKMAALACHKSQINPDRFAEMERRMRERYQLMAEGEGFELAETFHREELWR